MASSAAEVGPAARRREKVEAAKQPGWGRRWRALAFLGPGLIILGAVVVYPTIDTVVQSFQSDVDRQWVGVANYQKMVETDRMIRAIRNNAIWVAVAPAIITGLGLMFAILSERVRYATAIKVVVFMPMAISFLATGIIWRLMYEEDPKLGFVNAAIASVSDAFRGAGSYPGAEPSTPGAVQRESDGGLITRETVTPGESAAIGLTALAPEAVPSGAAQAAEPSVGSDAVGVAVWRDFRPGGGRQGVVENGELGLPDVGVELLDAKGDVVESATTGRDGSAVFSNVDGDGPFRVRVVPQTFSAGFTGVSWLGPTLVTPAIIGAFSWMWAGFAVVVIGAGLAALPRDVLEAARVDGASEWQTFRHVTLPLLAPVLGVVFVTLVINVLKIFDIVLVTAPGASQDEANVIALEMWKTSFTSRQYGLGSAIAVVLFVLVVPVMILNVRRFRREG